MAEACLRRSLLTPLSTRRTVSQLLTQTPPGLGREAIALAVLKTLWRGLPQGLAQTHRLFRFDATL
jgi:hypothetical protein